MLVHLHHGLLSVLQYRRGSHLLGCRWSCRLPCWRRGVAPDVHQGLLCPVGLVLALWLLGLALLLLVLAWLLASAGLGRGTLGQNPCSGFWGGNQDFHLVLVGYTLRCRGGVSSMRATPSLVLPLRHPEVTPRVACPLPLLVVTILTFFPISFLFSFPVRSVGLVWVMEIVL